MAMKSWRWARLLGSAAFLVVFVVGCGDFWQAPSGGGTSGTASFSLSNGGNITVSPGATTGNTVTVTVTPSNSFTGTVALTCAVSAPSNATSPATCVLNPASVSISGTTAEASTLNVSTTSTTTTGAYQITVTGTSGSVSETTSVCAAVGTSTSSCNSAATTSGVFYVLNQTTDQIVALNITSGALNTIGAYTAPAPLPSALTVAPNGQFLYVSTPDGIYLYTIGSNGALTLGNGGTRISGDPASTMQVDATNSWLGEAISGTTELFAIAINPSTGELAAANEVAQPFKVGLPASTVTQLAISPGDSSSCGDCYVFVAMGSGGTEAIHFNPSSANPFGSAGTIHPVNSASGDNAVAVDPTNRLLYVGESDALSGTQSGGLRVFNLSTLTEVTGSPYATSGLAPYAIAPEMKGNYVYVANRAVSGSSTGNIAGFAVTTVGTTYSLTALSTTATAGTTPVGLTEDGLENYILVVDSGGSPDLEAYTFDTTTAGKLDSALSSSTGTDPVQAVAIAAAP